MSKRLRKRFDLLAWLAQQARPRARSKARSPGRRRVDDEAAHALLSLPDQPTGIVTGNNMATIGAMRAARAGGLSVPADISIAGFDAFEWADCFARRLTLVAQPCHEIGRGAAFLLRERIAAPEGARRTARFDATLKLCGSCAGPR
jgi:LacI family transcriptional regulator